MLATRGPGSIASKKKAKVDKDQYKGTVVKEFMNINY